MELSKLRILVLLIENLPTIATSYLYAVHKRAQENIRT